MQMTCRQFPFHDLLYLTYILFTTIPMFLPNQRGKTLFRRSKRYPSQNSTALGECNYSLSKWRFRCSDTQFNTKKLILAFVVGPI